MKKLVFAALLTPALAFAQAYPTPTFNSLTLINPLAQSSGGTGTTSATGTGSAVLSNSPALVMPNLGTPSAVTLTNGTGLPISTGVSGLGTGVATGLANTVTGSGSPVLATSPSIASPTITGALTATGLVTPADLAVQAANTVLANVSGSTASPTSIPIPSCNSATSALQWTSGIGFGCNAAINASTLGGATFAAPGPIGSTTPSTGAFTALTATSSVTATGLITNADLAPQAANTVLANATGSSASPTAVAAGNGISIASGAISTVSPIVYTLSATSDNTAGLQAAINAAIANRVGLEMLGSGSVSGTLTIAGSVDWFGASRYQTFLNCTGTAICINVTAPQTVSIHDFLLGNPATTGSATGQTLINFSIAAPAYNYWPNIYNMSIGAAGVGINTGTSVGADIYNNVFSGAGTTRPVFINATSNNVPNCNGAMIRVHDNKFIGIQGKDELAVYATCVGDMFIQNNKIVGVDVPITFYFPEHDATGLATTSANFFIQGNSIELFAGTAISVNWAGGDSSDNFSNLLIQNNEMMFPTSASTYGVIQIIPSPGNVPWLTGVQITGNNFGGYSSGTNYLVNVQTGNGVVINNDLMSSAFAGTYALYLSSYVTNCTIGPNLTTGLSFAASQVYATCSPETAPY